MDQQNRKTAASKTRRIKNITKDVHPEYDEEKRAVKRVKRKPASQDEDKKRKQIAAKGRTSDDLPDEATRRRQINKKRAKRRRKARAKRFVQMLVACVILAAIVICALIIKNFNTGSRHDEKGVAAYNEGNYQQAIDEFKEAISYDTENPNYYTHLGMAYIEQKSYDEALGYFNEASVYAKDTKDRLPIERGRGIAHLCRGNYDEAISSFNTALQGQDETSDVYKDILYYKAEAQEKSGDYTAATATYNQIISINDEASARMMSGLAYMKMGDYALAETNLQAAISKSKKNYAIYRSLYEAILAQGKTAEAKEVLYEALNLSGKSGEDYFNRGMIYVDLGDLEQAVEMMETAKQKGFAPALLGLGEIQITKGDYSAAREYYEAFLESTDKSKADAALMAKAYNQYALCLMELEEYELAIENCRAGLNLNSRESDAALSYNMIVIYEKMCEWENAYNTAKTFVDKYPEDEKGRREFDFLESRMGN